MNTSLESVRADVKLALTEQPGEVTAALNGDGHTIYELTFYERSVPPAWLDEIVAKLYHEHELAGDDEGGPSVVKGVYALEFHKWVANHVVKKVDPTFRVDDGYIGRGRQARAIHEALAKWAAAGDA